MWSNLCVVSIDFHGGGFPLAGFLLACVMCFQVLHVAFIITISGAVIAFIWEAVITFICGAVIAALILILDVFCSSCGS